MTDVFVLALSISNDVPSVAFPRPAVNVTEDSNLSTLIHIIEQKQTLWIGFPLLFLVFNLKAK